MSSCEYFFENPDFSKRDLRGCTVSGLFRLSLFFSEFKDKPTGWPKFGPVDQESAAQQRSFYPGYIQRELRDNLIYWESVAWIAENGEKMCARRRNWRKPFCKVFGKNT